MGGFRGGQDEGSEAEMVQLVKRRCTDILVRKCERLTMVGLKRGRGRPKK